MTLEPAQNVPTPEGRELTDLVILGPSVSRQGNRVVNRDIMEMYKINGKAYVRVYMAVYNDGGGNENTLPVYKDFWQNSNGDILIHSRGDTLWVSFGQALRQLKWAEVYREQARQKQQTNNPLIRSVLVPADVILDIVAGATTEEYASSGLDLNVDKHYSANQFGLREDSIERLRQNALNGSLVTYSYANVSHEQRLTTWGTCKLMSELRDRYGVPNEGIPDLSTVTNGKGEFLKKSEYSKIANNLIEIYALYSKNSNLVPDDYTWPDDKVRSLLLDDFYQEHKGSEELTKEKLFGELVPAWASQARIAEVISQNYEEDESTADPDKIVRFTQTLEDISADPQFSDEHPYNTEAIDEAVRKTEARKSLLRKRERLLTSVKELNNLINSDIVSVQNLTLKRELGKFKGDLATRLNKEDLQVGLNVTNQQVDDLRQELKTFATTLEGLTLTGTDAEIAAKAKILARRETIKAKVYAIALDEKTEEVSKAIYDQYGQASKKRDKVQILYRNMQGNLYEPGRSEEKVISVLDRQTRVIFVGQDFSNTNAAELVSMIKKNFVGKELQRVSLKSIRGGDISDGDITLTTDIAQALSSSPDKPPYDARSISAEYVTFTKGNVVTREGAFHYHEDVSAVHDVVANRVTSVSGGVENVAGTPVQFDQGIPVYNKKTIPEAQLTKLVEVHGSPFKQAREQGYTGMLYFETKNPLNANDYAAINKDGTDIGVALTRERLIQEGLVTYVFGDADSKYSNQVIFQLDSDPTTETAARYLYEKHKNLKTNLGENTWWVRWNAETNQPDQVQGARVPIGRDTRVQVVGHGILDSSELQVSGKDTSKIAEIIGDHLTPKGSEIGRISVVTCNYSPNPSVSPTEVSEAFVRALMNDLNAEGRKIKTSVSVRNSLVRIDALGRKQYGTVIEDGKIRWHYRGDNDKTIGFWTKDGTIATQVVDAAKLHPVPTLEASGHLGLEEALQTNFPDYQVSLSLLEANRWADRWSRSIQALEQEAGIEGRWMPILTNTEATSNGAYRVQFINLDTQETRWLTSHDKTFVEFGRYVNEQLSQFKKDFSLEEGRIQQQVGIGEPEAIDGLNAGLAVQTMIQWFQRKSQEGADSEPRSPELAKALEIHAYLNMMQIGHGMIMDAAKVVNLIKTALRGEAIAAESTLSTFGKAFSHATGEGMGVLFGGASVGFDAYELAHAQNETQKAVFGTQLAFDSASLVTSVAGLGAGMMGAVSAGVVLGGAGVILGGLGIGFAALAQAFGGVAQNAQAVGHYFDVVDNAYKNGGYTYNADKGLLVPLAGAVIQSMDLRNNQIHFDSQYIYRTHHGSTGSGRRNYFFWVGDMPRMSLDRSQAINIRSGIGYGDTATLSHGDTKIVILPATPKSYIRYDYQALPGATMRHDAGFNVIRRLEEDYRFDYDFYIFPSEYIINRIYQEYVSTEINVYLDLRQRQLVVPDLPNELHGYLSYNIYGNGSCCVISLNEGVTLNLSVIDGSSQKTRWILNTSNLESDGVHITRDNLVVGNVTVNIPQLTQSEVWLISHNDKVSAIDFEQQTTLVLEENASQWVNTKESIEEHLLTLREQQRLGSEYVVVENYAAPIPDDPALKCSVGRAYYDVANDRFLYTDVRDETLTRNAELKAVIGDSVYFLNAEFNALWLVDANNHQVQAKYHLLFENDNSRIVRVWEEYGAVWIAQSLSSTNESEVELLYLLNEDRIALIGVNGNSALLDILSKNAKLPESLRSLLEQTLPTSDAGSVPVVDRLPGNRRNAEIGQLVTLSRKDSQGNIYRMWVRTTDGTVIKPNLEPPQDGNPLSSKPGVSACPDDLVLVGLQKNKHDQEVFFFYRHKEQMVYRQEGPGAAVLNPNHPTAHRLSIDNLVNVLKDSDALLAVTNQGLIQQIDAEGELHLAAVNETWLKAQNNWWQSLNELAIAHPESQAVLALLGIKDKNSHLLPAWYDVHHGKVVVASVLQQDKTLQYLGIAASAQGAWLFDAQAGKVYFQPLPTSQQLSQAFDGGFLLNDASALPSARTVLPNETLVSARMVADKLAVTTREGLVISVGDSGETKLVMVNEVWVQAHQLDLVSALRTLAGGCGYNHGEVIGVADARQSEQQESTSWYHVASGTVLTPNVNKGNALNYLGFDAASGKGYFVNESNSKLYTVDGTTTQIFSAVGEARRFGRTLFLNGTAEDDNLTVPVMDGVEVVVLSGDQGNDTYKIDADSWTRYRCMVIDNWDEDRSLDRVRLHFEQAINLLATQDGEHLVLADSISNKYLIVRNALQDGDQGKRQRHLHINLPNLVVIDLVDVIKALSNSGVVALRQVLQA